MNILMTDTRKASIEQKLNSFYPIIERCLTDSRSVTVVVTLGQTSSTQVQNTYSDCLADFLKNKYFNLYFLKPTMWNLGFVTTMAYIVKHYLKQRGTFVCRFNFACLSGLACARIRFFRDVYRELPCQNWLGLTGGVELPAFSYQRGCSSSVTTINALQFGQASLEQQHFSGYLVDKLFVYDELSRQMFEKLNMKVGKMIVSGSTEFEFHTNALQNNRLLEQNRLSIVFVDQPVQHRGEYTKEYLQSCLQLLKSLNDDPELKVIVKPHPRGSAFEGEAWIDFSLADSWADCLSKAHVVVGFFSNLCDFSLISGRVTFYVGNEYVLGAEKRDWIEKKGGFVIDNFEFLFEEISILKNRYVEITSEITSLNASTSARPSGLIFSELEGCDDTKTID